MKLNTSYQKCECFKQMNENERSRFCKIVEMIAPEIQGIPHNNGSVYTLHDFNHHCNDIYSNIDRLVLTEDAYKAVGRLSDRELYILNLAVLLHDIGMHKVTYINRERHAVLSSERIDELYNDSDAILSSAHSGLFINEIKALKRIVEAHSDAKNSHFKSALDNAELNEDISTPFDKIRVKLLAVILRIADELDITNNRLGSLSVKKELLEAEEKIISGKSMSDKEKEACENAVESLKHWKKLELVAEMHRQANGMVIAVTDDEVINRQIEQGESEESIADILAGIEKKICTEYERFNSVIKSNIEYVHIVGMKGFKIQVGNKSIADILEEKRRTGHTENGKDDAIPISVLAEDLSNEIAEFVKKRELVDGGHFFRQDGFCARDWINVREIIGTGAFFKQCETKILSYVAEVIKNRDKSYFLIGIDFSGMLIGSKIAIALNLPYAYAIPLGDDTEGVSERELTVRPEGKYDGVIILTDVIVTFHTISSILKRYSLEKKTISIIGILYRHPKNSVKLDQSVELMKNTVVLNKDFDIELQCNQNCLIKEQYGCIALNLPSR